ncbi:YopT-type cysteine protease domain-containing protein [Bradyrhizobium sp. 31Argb]|uniref:YopT-type cysteine protease domain-containing protein n=1 Tax=Bradyrhizobium sp. 31Argb TaxID=3141247 RepID=UPI003747E50C
MHNRIDQSSTYLRQNDALNNSFNSNSFDEQLADLARHNDLSPEDRPERMGCCASRADASDPARMSTSVFQYRTAELPNANVENICVGLAAEWLTNRAQSPASRMRALLPRSSGYRSAAVTQENYEDVIRSLRSQGVEGFEANFRARAAVFADAGLRPSEGGNTYAFDNSDEFSEMKDKIVSNERMYLLSLSFERGGRTEKHLVATSASDGIVTLFDPNYGEFTIPQGDVNDFFGSLANRYRSPPNSMELRSITTQRIRVE